MHHAAELENSLQSNNRTILELINQNMSISAQLWELRYKEQLIEHRGYLGLDEIVMLFHWENDINPLFKIFKEKVYCTNNSLSSLLETARQYGMSIPDIVMDIVCETCPCKGCNVGCNGSCEDCRKRHGVGYHSYCDD